MRGLYSFKRENIPILPDMFFWFRRQKKKKTKRKLVHFCKNQRFCSFSKRRYWKVCFWLGFANFYVRNHWVVLLCKCKDLRIKDLAVMGFWDAAHDISNINSAHSGVMSIHYKQYVQKEKVQIFSNKNLSYKSVVLILKSTFSSSINEGWERLTF